MLLLALPSVLAALAAGSLAPGLPRPGPAPAARRARPAAAPAPALAAAAAAAAAPAPGAPLALRACVPQIGGGRNAAGCGERGQCERLGRGRPAPAQSSGLRVCPQSAGRRHFLRL